MVTGPYRRVWFLSACTYIPTAREVGLIILDALNKWVKIKCVWLILRICIRRRVVVYPRLLSGNWATYHLQKFDVVEGWMMHLIIHVHVADGSVIIIVYCSFIP